MSVVRHAMIGAAGTIRLSRAAPAHLADAARTRISIGAIEHCVSARRAGLRQRLRARQESVLDVRGWQARQVICSRCSPRSEIPHRRQEAPRGACAQRRGLCRAHRSPCRLAARFLLPGAVGYVDAEGALLRHRHRARSADRRFPAAPRTAAEYGQVPSSRPGRHQEIRSVGQRPGDLLRPAAARRVLRRAA